MADSPIPPGLLDASGAIVDDLPCRKCGYNLRGLNEKNRCPECGVSVGLSTRGDLLRFGDPRWVETLARGLNLILWGLVVSILAGAVGALASRLVSPELGAACAIGGSMIGLYGAWLLTTPDPSNLGESDYGRARRFMRVALLCGLLGTALGLPPPSLSKIPGMETLIAVLGGVLGLIGLAGEFAKWWYVERLAMRVPELDLAVMARKVRWGMTGFMGISIVGGLIIVLITGATNTPRGTVVGMAPGLICFIGIASLGSLIMMLMAVRLQWRLRNVLRLQAAIAREMWAE